MRTVVSAVILSVLLGSAGACLAADRTQYTADVLQYSGYKDTWEKTVKGLHDLPSWVRKGKGTSDPLERRDWKGSSYQVGTICKPHECWGQFMKVAFGYKTSHVWAVYVELPDTDDAMMYPSKHAKYTWLGKPSEEIKSLLMHEISKNPNWK